MYTFLLLNQFSEIIWIYSSKSDSIAAQIKKNNVKKYLHLR